MLGPVPVLWVRNGLLAFMFASVYSIAFLQFWVLCQCLGIAHDQNFLLCVHVDALWDTPDMRSPTPVICFERARCEGVAVSQHVDSCKLLQERFFGVFCLILLRCRVASSSLV